MGFFSGKTIITVHSAMYPMIRDTPDVIKDSTIQSIIEGKNVADGILEGLVNGMGFKLNQLKQRTFTKYPELLITGSVVNIGIDYTDVEAYLNTLNGSTDATVSTLIFAPNNWEWDLAFWLVNNKDWNPSTGYINLPVVVKPTETPNPVVVTDGDTTTTTTQEITYSYSDPYFEFAQRAKYSTGEGQYEEYPETFWYGYSYNETKTTTTTVVTETTTTDPETEEEVTTTDTVVTTDDEVFTYYPEDIWGLDYSFSGYDSEYTTSVQTQFLPNSSYSSEHAFIDYTVNGIRKFWLGLVSTNSFLSTVSTKTDSNFFTGSYFPVLPVRYNNLFLLNSDNTEQNKTLKLLKVLGIDSEELQLSLEENPDIDQIDNAFVTFGVNLSTDNEVGKEFIYTFFNELQSKDSTSLTAYNYWVANKVIEITDPESGNVISQKLIMPEYAKLELSSGNYDLTIEYLYSEITTVSKTLGDGSIGNVNIYCTTRPELDISISELSSLYIQQDSLILEKQISIGTVEQIEIFGLVISSAIYGNKTHEFKLSDAFDFDADGVPKARVAIPLSSNFYEELSLTDKTKIAYESVNLVIEAVEITKLKWYQTKFFSFLVTAVGMYFGAPALGKSLAAASTSLLATAIVIMKQIVLSLVINFGFKLLAKVVGDDLALLLAISTLVVGFSQDGEFGKGLLDPKSTFADKLLSFSSNMVNGISANLEEQFKDLTDEYNVWKDQQELQQEQLDNANALLANDYVFDPLGYTRTVSTVYLPNESPSSFYERTVHSGNIGTAAYDMVHSYHDTNLQLPKLI